MRPPNQNISEGSFMHSISPVVLLIGMSGVAKSRILLAAAAGDRERLHLIDGMAPGAVFDLPLPSSVDVIAIDHFHAVADPTSISALALAWAQVHGKAIYMVAETASDFDVIAGLLPDNHVILGLETDGYITVGRSGRSVRISSAELASGLIGFVFVDPILRYLAHAEPVQPKRLHSSRSIK